MALDVVAVPGNDGSPLVVALPFGLALLLLLSRRVDPLVGQAAGDRNQQGDDSLQALQAAQRDRDSKPKHQIAEDTFVAGSDEGLAHPPAIDAQCNEGTLGLDFAAQPIFKEFAQLGFERVLQTRSVHQWRLPDVAHHRLDGMKRIPAAIDEGAKVRAAEAERIDLPIQSAEQFGCLLHIAVGADALNAHLLAEQLDVHRFVARGGTNADADRSLHRGSVLLAGANQLYTLPEGGSIRQAQRRRDHRLAGASAPLCGGKVLRRSAWGGGLPAGDRRGSARRRCRRGAAGSGVRSKQWRSDSQSRR